MKLIKSFILYVLILMVLGIHNIELQWYWNYIIALICVVLCDEPTKQSGKDYEKDSKTRRF